MKSKNSVYKFIDLEDMYNIKNLEKNELLCKSFDYYNDPYENHYGISTRWPLAATQTNRLKKIVEFLDPHNADEILKSKPFTIKVLRANESKISELTLNYLSKVLSSFRICSFTRRWNHVMMWSHYANGASGAVLILDADQLIEGTFIREPNSDLDINCYNSPLDWVQYKNSPPILNSIDVIEAICESSKELLAQINKEITTKCVLTKFKSWRYEQESRLILNLDKDIGDRPVLYRYPNTALKGVLIGNRCSEKNT